MAPAVGPPCGEDVDLGEGLEAEHGQHDDQEHQHRRHQRQRDPEEASHRAEAVERGRLEHLLGHGLQAGQHDDERQARGSARSTTATRRTAPWSGFASQSTWNTPTCGLISTKKITEATATDVATVEVKTVWKNLMPLQLAVGRDGQERAEDEAGGHRVEHVLERCCQALGGSRGR